MYGQMSKREWHKFIDERKNPKINAYMRASNKSFEETRAEFNAVMSKKPLEIKVDLLNTALVGVNGTFAALSFIGGQPFWTAVHLFCGVFLLPSLFTKKGGKAALQKAVKQEADMYHKYKVHHPYY